MRIREITTDADFATRALERTVRHVQGDSEQAVAVRWFARLAMANVELMLEVARTGVWPECVDDDSGVVADQVAS